jgi:lysyl-tRNA synthetase class 2
MKRMLGRGIGPIYQLARVFRNGERSRTHAPEFTMLEWYRSPGTLAEIMDDTEALIAAVAAELAGPWRPLRFERISVSDAFLRVGLGDPLAHPEIGSLQSALGVAAHASDSWEDVFFRAFLEQVEPSFLPEVVTLLFGYPARMAALARLDREDPRRAERFEVYAGAIELANAFFELTDPVEQRRRFEQDLEARRRAGAPLYPIDQGFLADLGSIGEAAGIALGADRLFMLAMGLDAVQDGLAFSPRDADR